MFTKEDYTKYFNSIILMERTMAYLAANILEQIDDNAIKAPLSKIFSDECRHHSGVSKVFENIFNNDNQLKLNDYSIGEITLKLTNSDKKFSAYCVHVYKNNIGLVSDQTLTIGDECELNGIFNKNENIVNQHAIIKWVQELYTGTYLIGCNII